MYFELERFNRWLRRRSPRATTHIHYTSDLKFFYSWVDKPPSAINIQDIDAFIEHCQSLDHAIATVNRRLAAIRSFYLFLAIDSPDAPPNPVLPKRHFIRQGRRLPRDAEDAKIERLFFVISSERDRAMFLLMLRSGLRVSEVRNLSLNDLYLRPAPGNLPRLWLNGKNGSQRLTYLSPHTHDALETWLAVRPNVDDQAVFLNRFGRRLTVTGIQDRLGHHCRQAGIWITCHQLRHTFARHMVEAGVPVTTIQKLLGHKRLRTTQAYLHISDQQVQANYEAAIAEIAQRLWGGVR